MVSNLITLLTALSVYMFYSQENKTSLYIADNYRGIYLFNSISILFANDILSRIQHI